MSLAWSPTGRWIASGLQNGDLKLWDLLAIRRELGALGLDWAGPPALLDAAPGAALTLRMEVDLGPAAKARKER
jgi:hypothetical protein